MPSSKGKNLTFNEIYLKASSFCAYQERTQQEVRDKLYGQKVDKDVAEEVISKLIEDNFINEERFAVTYAGGKFRMKKWGRVKIKEALKQKGLSVYCIKKGMEEIEEEDYLKTLDVLLSKKNSLEKEKNIFKKKDKLSKYLLQKGYEADLVWKAINSFFDKK
ncbi:MAG: RecX family transcriptional regulator [Cytophagaceae bacterium]|nr:RecX family transcriptional regulator [Cytophagaceae bacterium]